MGANPENLELTDRLDQEPEFKARGFSASCGPTGGVVVDRWGHVRGVWHFINGSYYWTPAGYNEPIFRTTELAATIRYTLEVVGKT